MCRFFSFNTEPEKHGGMRFYFNWDMRKADPMFAEYTHYAGHDSHSTIAKYFGLNEDVCNKYEYNPLTGEFTIDQINSEINDSVQAEEWVRKLDFKKVVEPLIIKPIVDPFKLPKVDKPTEEQITLLKEWASVRASVRALVWASVGDSVMASVWDSVWDSVWASVGDSVMDSVWDSVGASVWDSVWDSIRAYALSFYDIKYEYDFAPCIRLWEAGLVPSFDWKVWRLHSGKNADVVYEWTPEEGK